MEIRTELVLKIMSNYNAARIVNEEYIQRLPTFGYFSTSKLIPVDEYAKIFNFDESEITGILYCKEVKKRYNLQFNQIIKEIKFPNEYQYTKQLADTPADKLHEFVKSTPELIGDLKSNFPTLPIYTVPGEKTSGPDFIYVALFPSWYNEDFDYTLIKYMHDKGMLGASVIRLSMNLEDAKLLLALVKETKIEAIICYYDGGGQCYDWSWVISHLYDGNNDARVFNDIQKNTTSNESGEEGINFDFLDKIAKTYVRRTREGVREK